MALSTRENPRPSVDVTRARQGRSGRHVLWVLAFSLLLVIVAFAATLLSHSDELGRTNANNGRAGEAPMFNAPEPAPINSAVEGNNAPDNLGPAGGQRPNASSPTP